jgi:hypothetical protein
MVTRRYSSRRGVALIDAIIAAILLGIGLVTIVSIASGAMASARLGQEIGTAAGLADEQLQLVLARGPDNYGRSYPLKGTCDAPFQQYTFELEFSGGTQSSPFHVRSTVRWDSARGRQSVYVQTLIAPRTVQGDALADPDRRPTTTVERTP